jgi:uncharacterized YigZ family protein
MHPHPVIICSDTGGNMRLLLEQCECELEVRKSRFIAIAIPITALSEIKDLVTQTRALHAGANHVVHAAVLGERADIHSYSDDHEPKNTAGRPAFEVLKGSGITNILVLVVRYFGGTLLGTGGLVKAYGDSVKEVLKLVKTEALIEKSGFSMTIPYNLYDIVKKRLIEMQATIDHEEFTTDITLQGSLPSETKNALAAYLTECSNGSCSVQFSDV